MKAAGLLLLAAGWIIAVSAVALLKTTPLRAAFVFSGIAVEALGFVLLARAHLTLRRDSE